MVKLTKAQTTALANKIRENLQIADRKMFSDNLKQYSGSPEDKALRHVAKEYAVLELKRKRIIGKVTKKYPKLSFKQERFNQLIPDQNRYWGNIPEIEREITLGTIDSKTADEIVEKITAKLLKSISQ
jgi:hypothetical protein